MTDDRNLYLQPGKALFPPRGDGRKWPQPYKVPDAELRKMIERDVAPFPRWQGVPSWAAVVRSIAEGSIVEWCADSTISAAGNTYARLFGELPTIHPLALSATQISLLPRVGARDWFRYLSEVRLPFRNVYFDFCDAEHPYGVGVGFRMSIPAGDGSGFRMSIPAGDGSGKVVGTEDMAYNVVGAFVHGAVSGVGCDVTPIVLTGDHLGPSLNATHVRTPEEPQGAPMYHWLEACGTMITVRPQGSEALNHNDASRARLVLPLFDETDLGELEPNGIQLSGGTMWSNAVIETLFDDLQGNFPKLSLDRIFTGHLTDLNANRIRGVVVTATPAAGVEDAIDAFETSAPLSKGSAMEARSAEFALATITSIACEPVCRALMFLDTHNVEIVPAGLHKREVKRAEKRGWPIASTVTVRRKLSRRSSDARAPSDGEQRYSHQFEVIGRYNHVTVGTHVRCRECNGEGGRNDATDNGFVWEPCGLCLGTGRDPSVVKPCTRRDQRGHLTCPDGCRREWIPQHWKGNPDGPAVPKARILT